MRVSWMSLARSTQCPHGIILDTEKEKETENQQRKQRQRHLQQNYVRLFSCSLFLCSALAYRLDSVAEMAVKEKSSSH